VVLRVGLAKSKPTSHAEVLKQPIFSNPLILNTNSLPREYVVLVKDAPLPILATPESKIFGTQRARQGKAWKSFQALRMIYHATNRNSREIIIASIPWNFTT
jgi:hypothetical protein